MPYAAATMSDCSAIARSAIARTAASFIRSLLFLAALKDDAGDVGDPDILSLQSQLGEQVEARQRSGTRARADELDAREFLADHAQAIEDRSADDDRGAVLVVVKHGYLHALAAHALDIKAFGRLDVLKVDAAERRLERADDVDELLRVALVDLDVEAVNSREFLE